jgi:hypothetical protein
MDSNSRHKNQKLTSITVSQKPTCHRNRPLLSIRQETDDHYFRQNAQPLGKKYSNQNSIYHDPSRQNAQP